MFVCIGCVEGEGRGREGRREGEGGEERGEGRMGEKRREHTTQQQRTAKSHAKISRISCEKMKGGRVKRVNQGISQVKGSGRGKGRVGEEGGEGRREEEE